MEDLRHIDSDLARLLSSPRAIWSDSTSFSLFLRTIDDLLRTIQTLESTASHSPSRRAALTLELADEILHKSMSRLQREFTSLLADGNPTGEASDLEFPEDELEDPDLIPVAEPVKDFNVIIDALPTGIIEDLGQIARRMAAAGFGKDCADAYSASRREFVGESMARLGMRSWSREEVKQMPERDLDDEIKRWNQAMKVVFLILFPSERRLADKVFAGLASIADLGFADSCRDVAVSMLRFAEGAVTGSRAPERLFKVIDTYEVLRDLLPEIEMVFSDRYCSALVTEFDACCARLAETIRGIFTELEKSVHRDPAKPPLQGGGVHPITRYVVNYLHAAASAWPTLEEVMGQEEDTAIPTTVDQLRSSTSLSAQIGWIMDRLNGNLEAKSKMYRNEALSYVFLMNNSQYMVERLVGSELKHMLGNEWMKGQVGKVRQWLNAYQKRGWGKVIATVQSDGTAATGSIVFVKQKLGQFYQHIEETCDEHSSWMVTDKRLREEIRTLVVGAVVPAYRRFLEAARAQLGRRMDVYVKYRPEEVQARIMDLFGGTPER